MALNLPDPFIAGPFQMHREDVEDPEKLLKLLQGFSDRLTGAQQNFESVGAQFPLSSSLLQVSNTAAAANGLGLALTTTAQDQDIGPGVSLAGDYMVFAGFEFNVSGAGVGRCVGEVKSDSYGVGNLECAWAPSGTGQNTVSVANSISVTPADNIYWRVRKTINAGTATLENATMLLVGPFG